MLAHAIIEAALADNIEAQEVPTRAFWRDGADEGRMGVFLVAYPPTDIEGTSTREFEILAVCRGDTAQELTVCYEALMDSLSAFSPDGVCYGGHSITQGLAGFDEVANTMYCDVTINFKIGMMA